MNIRIKAAREISAEYQCPMVVVFAIDEAGTQHVTTYGQTVSDSRCAATAGNRLKAHLGWPDDLCKAKPVERICGNCRFFEPDYGYHCFNGWSGDGSRGECLSEPVKVKRGRDDTACKHFEGKDW